MTKRERIMSAIAGSEVDRLPYSLWYHFRLDPPAGEAMSSAELGFYRRFDPDLLKVMHDIEYEMPATMPQVQTIEDWERLPVHTGLTGNFGKQLETVRTIIAKRGDDGPVVDTIFNTFATAQKICGGKTLEFLRKDPERTKVGLDAITASLSNYAQELVGAGADGIYLALTGAASDTMDATLYNLYFAGCDQQVLEAAAAGTTNVVHHHGVGIHVDIALALRGYQIYSWSNRLKGNPSLREMRVRTKACLMGGVDETTFGQASPADIVQQSREAIAETNGRGFILAPGCAVPTPPESPAENLAAFRAAVVAA